RPQSRWAGGRSSPWTVPGTLASVPLAGGTPRELATDVQWADWALDGKAMAVVRGDHLEFPARKTIYRTRSVIIGPRVSPEGDQVAFVEDHRWIRVVDRSGSERFAREFPGIASFAWKTSGDEILTANSGEPGVVRTLTLSGKERIVFRSPNHLAIKDVSR